jgi:hypothetical protein
MKEQFITRAFKPETEAILAEVNRILDSYAEQGFKLTLRQLFYQFIGHDLFPESWIDEEYNRQHGLDPRTKNTEKNYKRLGSIVTDGRLAGVVDWDMIEDRGREVVEPPHWDSPADIVQAAADSFRVDKWADQPNHVEVMVEKQALEGVLVPVCRELDVPFTANKGYSSSSAMYEASKRMARKIRDGKRVHVIYLGDHDPSGVDMSRDVTDRLNLFLRDFEEVTLHRVALNMDQVRRLHLPENPTKASDSRAEGYVAEYGSSCWELDAIEPSELSRIVTRAVTQLRDKVKWDAAKAREDGMREELQDFADGYGRETSD